MSCVKDERRLRGPRSPRRRKPRPPTRAPKRRSEPTPRGTTGPALPARRALLAATRSIPHLRANPCPEVTDRICRLPLPTLFYRPEAVHLGDLLRIRVRPDVKITLPPAGFQGPTPMHRTPREARRFTDATSLSLDNRIPGSPLLTKKRELFPGSTLASPRSVALPHWAPRGRSPTSGSGILTRFPFDRIGVSSEAAARDAHAAVPVRFDRGACRQVFACLVRLPRARVQMTSLVFAYFALQFDHLRYCNVFAGFDARGSAEHFIA